MFSVFSLAAFSATGEWWQLLLAAAGIAVSFIFGPILSDDWRRAVVPSLVGLACAWFLFLFLVQSSAGWNATHDRRESANELWWADTVPTDIVQLHQAMEQISEWQTGEPGELAAVIEWREDSALGWELLTYPAAQYVSEPDLLSTPAVIVAPRIVQGNGVVSPHLTVAYRGEEFGSVEQRGWSGLPPDLIGWLLYRRGPLLTGQMILWTRVDILTPDAGSGA